MTTALRLLIDNALSPRVAPALTAAGHDVLHVRDFGLHTADDGAVFDYAKDDERVLVSADTDFGTLLALRAVGRPSVVLRRRDRPRAPDAQARIVAAVLKHTVGPRRGGAIVVIDPKRFRVRDLPIH